MKRKISLIGGDLRIIDLAKLLKESGFEVLTYALEQSDQLDEFLKCRSLEKALNDSNIVVSSIPLSQDGKYVKTPFSSEKILITELFRNLENKIFVAGKLNTEFTNSKSILAYDILTDEEYLILNAIPTAEGAVAIAINEYPKTICGSNVLIMGFGRIGKIVSKLFYGIGAKVYCEARKSEDLAYISAYGYIPISLNDLDQELPKFDIIINNIPKMILDKKQLDFLKKDVLIIDLASNPGGVNFEYAKSRNIKTIWALGLPGKVAPVSSAEYIKKIIENKIMMNERIYL